MRKILKILGYVFRSHRVIRYRIYLNVFVIPFFRLINIISGPIVIQRGFRSFLLLTKESVIKIALGRKSTVCNEVSFFRAIKTKVPQLDRVLPKYEYLEYLFISALKTERLSPVTPENCLPIALAIQDLFDEVGLHVGRLELSECKELSSGIGYFRDTFGLDVGGRLEDLVVEFLRCGNYRVGFTHGDFHSRNVMIASDGSSKIIDLDCIRFKGIRELDALYFSLEKEWSETGSLWVESLLECLRGGGSKVRKCLQSFKVEWSDELAVIFFLDRVGQEYRNFQIRYPKDLLIEFLDVLEILSEPGSKAIGPASHCQ